MHWYNARLHHRRHRRLSVLLEQASVRARARFGTQTTKYIPLSPFQQSKYRQSNCILYIGIRNARRFM